MLRQNPRGDDSALLLVVLAALGIAGYVVFERLQPLKQALAQNAAQQAAAQNWTVDLPSGGVVTSGTYTGVQIQPGPGGKGQVYQ